ncbi:MAG: sulfatase-like hydrolase/transferase [Planctomycetota bacterium]
MNAGGREARPRLRLVVALNLLLVLVLCWLLWQRLQPRFATDVRVDLLLDPARVELIEGFDGVDHLVSWNDEKRTNPDRREIVLPVRRTSRLRWQVEARPGRFVARVGRLQGSPDADATACVLRVTAIDAEGREGPTQTVPVPACPAGAEPPPGVPWREGPAAEVLLELPHGAATLELSLQSPDGAPEGAWVGLYSPHVDQEPAAERVADVRNEVPDGSRLLWRVTSPEERVPFGRRQLLDADAQPAGEPETVHVQLVEALGGFVGSGGAGADERPALVLTGDARCELRLDIPQGAVLRTSVALDERLPPGTAVTLEVHVESALVASHRVTRSRWTALDVPLEGHEGRDRRLAFSLTKPALEPAAVDYLEPDYDRGAFVSTRVTAERVRVGLADPVVERTRVMPRRSASRERPSVILIQVETLRADVLPFHEGLPAGAPPLAPTMQALAAGGVVWEAAMTPSPWTLPTAVSLFTGLLPSAHGAVDHQHMVLPGDRPTLAERALGAGLATGAVVASDILRPHAGFARGFQEFAHVPYSNARQVNDLAGAFLENHVGQQFLLFLHYFDPHGPYNAPGEWRDRYVEQELRGLTVPGAEGRWKDAMLAGTPLAEDDPDMRFLYQRYLGEIAWFDHQLGELLAGIERLGLDDSTIIVLTADHGEEFMEHGLYGHGSNLHDETLHVPLIVRAPEDLRLRWPRGTRVAGVAGTTSLYASVLAWMGVPYDAEAVVPPLEHDVGFTFSETSKGIVLAPDRDPFRRFMASTRTVDERMIHRGVVDDEPGKGSWTLFDLEADPGATEPVLTTGEPEGTALHRHNQYMSEALTWSWTHRAAAALSGGGSAMLETLRELGYVGDDLPNSPVVDPLVEPEPGPEDQADEPR